MAPSDLSQGPGAPAGPASDGSNVPSDGLRNRRRVGVDLTLSVDDDNSMGSSYPITLSAPNSGVGAVSAAVSGPREDLDLVQLRITASDHASPYSQDMISNALLSENGEHLRPDFLTTVQMENITPAARQSAVEWLLDLAEPWCLLPETISHAVLLMDRFLSTTTIIFKHLQLVAAASLLIAAKLREHSAPSISELTHAALHEFGSGDLVKMEILITTKLLWDVNINTAHDFVKLYISEVSVQDRDLVPPHVVLLAMSDPAPRIFSPDVDIKRIRDFCEIVIDVSMCAYSLVRYPPSVIAATALACGTALAGYPTTPLVQFLAAIGKIGPEELASAIVDLSAEFIQFFPNTALGLLPSLVSTQWNVLHMAKARATFSPIDRTARLPRPTYHSQPEL